MGCCWYCKRIKNKKVFFVNRTREMVSFKLGKEIEKDAFTKKTSFSISIPFFLILFQKYDAIDTANPNSMQDTYHM